MSKTTSIAKYFAFRMHGLTPVEAWKMAHMESKMSSWLNTLCSKGK